MLYLTPLLPQPSESPFPESLPPYVGAVLFETFLYGLYVILFAICAYVLLRRNTPLHWILLAIATVMFALATSDLVYTYGLLFRKLLQGGLTYANLRPKYWLYVTNNVLADALLLYRCFVVWEFRKLVLLGPVALLIAAAACGYAFEGANTFLFENAWIYLALTLILNVVLPRFRLTQLGSALPASRASGLPEPSRWERLRLALHSFGSQAAQAAALVQKGK